LVIQLLGAKQIICSLKAVTVPCNLLV